MVGRGDRCSSSTSPTSDRRACRTRPPTAGSTYARSRTGTRRSPGCARSGAASTSSSTTRGWRRVGRIDVESIADWERVVDINLLGVAAAATRSPRSSRSSAAATSSTSPRSPGSSTGRAWRATTRPRPGRRHQRDAVVRARALGIDVSVVCPAFFRTNLHESFAGKDAEMQEAGMRLITRARSTAERRGSSSRGSTSGGRSSSPTGWGPGRAHQALPAALRAHAQRPGERLARRAGPTLEECLP